MPLELVTIPCRTDNYAFLIGDPETDEAALVDIPEAGPINAALEARGWRLTTILITHHHADHVEGLSGLSRAGDARVIGAAADAHRLPALDLAVSEGDEVTILGSTAVVIEVPGHTVGHIAFHMPREAWVFTADSLMALGCGRLFEGSATQMWDSLSKLAALPPDTLVCSGHEYTQANARFALSVEPDNPDLMSRSAAIDAARDKGTATVPSRLSDEIATNPFLRAARPDMAARLGLTGRAPADVFAELRARKDAF